MRVITRATFRADGAGYRDGARHSRIYLVPVRSGREPGAGRQLDGTRISELEPTYSADGRTLFFRGRDVEETDFAPAKTLLYAVDAGGGTPRIVATIDGAAAELSPSPDGRLIAFHGRRERHARAVLHAVRSLRRRHLERRGPQPDAQRRHRHRRRPHRRSTRASRRRGLTAGMDAGQRRAGHDLCRARTGQHHPGPRLGWRRDDDHEGRPGSPGLQRQRRWARSRRAHRDADEHRRPVRGRRRPPTRRGLSASPR